LLDIWKLFSILAILAVTIPVLYFASIIFKSQIIDLQMFIQYTFFNFYEENIHLKAFYNWPLSKPFTKILMGNFAENIVPTSDLQIGPRPKLLYGNGTHYVTLTFYIQNGNTDHIKNLLIKLIIHHVSKAIFFVQKNFVEEHPFIMEIIKQRGYKIYPWDNIAKYDRNYPPTVFRDIVLSDREIVPRAYEGKDITTLYDIALHYENASIIAFTPQVPPKFLYFDTLLQHILENNDHDLIFSDSNRTNEKNVFDRTYLNKGFMSIGHLSSGVLQPDFDSHRNSTTDLIIRDGIWDMNNLHAEYPLSIEYLPSVNSFLIHKTIVISENAQLNINNTRVFIQSSSQNDHQLPRHINIRDGGKATIFNSTVTSWDPVLKSSDPNPYHPRPYLVAQDGGKMDIINSTVSYLGFPLGSIDDTRYARAGINYFNTTDFTIANSTIAFNYYGFYSSEARNYKFIGNNVYGSIKYGLDPHSASRSFVVDSNYLHDNGKQGFICSKYCKDIIITNNLVENNMEGIGLHWSTNSSIVKNNIVRNNEKNGIYIDKKSYYNIIQNNTSIGNMFGIGILDRSEKNTLVNNTLLDNRLGPLQIEPGAESNSVKENIMKVPR
jgi:parallel beta-helix repeat protein